ncbi:MAG: cysteine desulfurase [Oscillospiraceae bacterium]|nr:cysteine desulfurase [Oscillospiraceae bacterium]MCR5173420.1 cysteine desulfurase [Oscillospiraceae bacterium]
MIYADNAATTKMSRTAVEAMLSVLGESWGNPSSLYEHGQRAKDVLEAARKDVAAVIGADPREILFTSGGSEADNQAIRSAAALGAKSGKKHIISTAFEHHAVLHTLERLKQEGYEITLLDVHENGIVLPEEVEAAIREDTCLVSVMYANNEIGTIQPIREIGAVCRARNVLFHTDAVQAVGHIPVNVGEDNVDLLSASAHKFHGPKGVGFLYARKGVRLTNLIEGGAQERGKRAGTENVPGIAAMAAALKEADAAREANAARLTVVRDRLIAELKQIPHSALNGDEKCRLPGNVNFCFEGIEGESLLLLLDDKGIAASSGSACTSGSLDPSHVLLAIGRVHDVAHGSLRLSIGEDITDEQADTIVRSVKEVVEYLRGISPIWRDLTSGKKDFIL